MEMKKKEKKKKKNLFGNPKIGRCVYNNILKY